MINGTDSDNGRGGFPTTDWGLFVDIRSDNTFLKLAALDILIRRYWRPVYIFLKYSGKDEHDAKDLTQAFFANWAQQESFGKADPQKGRFRSFLLSSLKRFAQNEHRAAQAKKRAPTAGLLSLDELMDNPEHSFEPATNLTPEAAFNQVWAKEVVQRVLTLFEKECAQTDKAMHYAIFSRRLILPILDGASEPSYAALAEEFSITEKQAANCLLTAKRAFQRLLKDEISLYAASEQEISMEVKDLFSILSLGT